MFNALRSDELLVGIGQVLRMAADSSGGLEEYERSQLLSAFSVSRLLAAEQLAEVELLAWLRAELESDLADGDEAPVVAARARVAAAQSGVEVGEALAELLAVLPADDPRRAPVHRTLAELADREVAALAKTPG